EHRAEQDRAGDGAAQVPAGEPERGEHAEDGADPGDRGGGQLGAGRGAGGRTHRGPPPRRGECTGTGHRRPPFPRVEPHPGPGPGQAPTHGGAGQAALPPSSSPLSPAPSFPAPPSAGFSCSAFCRSAAFFSSAAFFLAAAFFFAASASALVSSL